MSTTRRIDIGLYGQDKDLKTKVASLKVMLEDLKKGADIDINMIDDKAKVELLDIKLKLDRLDDRVSKPSISLRGADRVLLDIAKIDLSLDALSKKGAKITLDDNNSIFSRFKNILSGSRSSKGFNISSLLSGEAAEGAGGLPELASPAGIGILGGIGSLIGALIPGLAGGALGLGVGGAGVYGLSKENPGLLSGITKDVSQTLSTAFKSLSTNQVGMGRIGNKEGPMAIPGTSVLAGVKSDLAQIGGFVKSIGPELGHMFAAAVPLVGEFVKGLEPAVRQILPLMTQDLKGLGPTIKILSQTFGNLLVAAAKTIDFMSPGFKASAEVIRGAVNIIDVGLESLGKLFGFLAQAWQKTASLISDVVHGDFSKAFSDGKSLVSLFVHGIYNLFGVLDHDVESIFNSIERNMILGVSRGVIAAEGWFGRLPGMAAEALASLPGRLYSIGRNAILSLVSGLRSDIGGVTSLIGSLASEVTGIHLPSFHFAQGGLITEPVIGYGLRSGASYSLGENGPEYVSPAGRMSNNGGDVYNIYPPDSATNADAYGLTLVQAIRSYKRHHGGQPTGIG